MDPQPDIDLLIESQIQAQLEKQAGREEVRPDEQVTVEPDSAGEPGFAPSPAENPTLQDFFGKMGTTPVAPEVNGKKHPTVVARENFKRALADLKEVQEAPGEEDGTRHRYLPIVAPAALVAVMVGIMTLLPQTPTTLPPQLIGSWETSAGKYSDRTLRISESEIAFEQGSREGFASYPIIGVAAESNGGGAFDYVITYDNEGTVHRFSFIHQPGDNTITLKNQPQVVWEKNRK